MKKYCTLTLCLCIVLYTYTAYTQTVYRRNITPTGFQINDCCFIGDSTVITVGSDGTMLYTDNMFHTWVKKEILVRQHLHSIHYAGNGTCVAVGDDGIILRSTDKGIVWSLVKDTPVNDTLTDITTNNKGTLFATGYKGCIIKSTDNGITWSAEYYPEIGNAQKIAFFDSIGIIGGTGKSIVRSTDWGTTWQKIQHPYNAVYSICYKGNNTWIVGCDSVMVGFSEDGGKTWSLAKRILPAALGGIGYDEIRDIVFTDELTGYAGGLFYVYDNTKIMNNVIVTKDGGKTWSSGERTFTLPGLVPAYPRFVRLHTSPDKQTLLVSGRYSTEENPYIALYYNNNTWKNLLFGEGETEFIQYDKDTVSFSPIFVSLRYNTPQKALALQAGFFSYLKKGIGEWVKRIAKTEDGGMTWKTSLLFADSLRIDDMFVIDTTDILAYVVKKIGDNAQYEGLWRSRDNATTWKKDTVLLNGIKKALNDTAVSILKISLSDNGLYYAAVLRGTNASNIRNHIVQSSNKGNDWEITPLPIGKNEELYGAIELLLKNSDKGMVWVDTYDSVLQQYSRKLFTTNNGGKNWQILFEKSKEAFAWYAFERLGTKIWRAEFEDSKIDNTLPSWCKIIYSDNNGEQWDTLDLEQSPNKAILKNFYCSRITFIDENTGIMEMTLKSDLNAKTILTTNNGGRDWRILPFNSNDGYLTYEIVNNHTVALGCRRNALYHFNPSEIMTSAEETHIENTVPAIHIWNVYPNPAEKGKIHLQLTWLENVQPNDMNFRLYTVEGIEQTHSLTVENWVKGAGYGIVTLNTQSVPNGLYILSCESGTYKTAKIIIVNR